MRASVIDGNSKSLSVECCLETKMRRDVKLLYDVMADTIGYIQVKMRAASLQLTDYKLTSLGALRGKVISTKRINAGMLNS